MIPTTTEISHPPATSPSTTATSPSTTATSPSTTATSPSTTVTRMPETALPNSDRPVSKAKTLEDPFESKDTPADVKNMRMQRGERLEAEIDWHKVRTLFVLDEMANKIKFTDIFKKQKTIIVLVRHFLDFIAKEYVEDLALIPLEYLQNADVRLVVIGPADHQFVKAFKEVTGFHNTLYTDPDREVYKALGCLDKFASGSLTNSKHIKSGFISGFSSSIWRAMRSQEKKLQGDPKQQGGTFIFGPDEQVHFCHIDQSSTDHCPINHTLSRAGVTNVSFPNDPRIQIV